MVLKLSSDLSILKTEERWMTPSSIIVRIQNKQRVMLASLRGTNLCQTLYFVFYTVLFFYANVCKIMLLYIEYIENNVMLYVDFKSRQRQNNKKGSLWIVERNCQ